MRVRFFALIILFLPEFLNAGDLDLIGLRNLYYKASVSKASADEFHQVTGKNVDINANLLLGYHGISWMIRANHSFNPYHKLKFFLEGKNILERAIAKDTLNVELRFLRFCVQTNAPSFLMYSDQVRSDKIFILKAYPGISDQDLKIRIKEYLVSSSYCSKEEKLIFK